MAKSCKDIVDIWKLVKKLYIICKTVCLSFIFSFAVRKFLFIFLQGKLKQLESLQLVNCDITKIAEYRRKVFRVLKVLKELDGKMKTEEDGGMFFLFISSWFE